MVTFVTLNGNTADPRPLTPEEVESLFTFCKAIHDHTAATPAGVVYWVRTNASNGRWVN